MSGRPVPTPSALTAPFWDATRRGELRMPFCDGCGSWFFTPEARCPRCLAAGWRYRGVAGTGTVYSVTVVHRAPGPGFDVPFALAIVELDEGVSLLSHVVGVAPEDVRIGQRVRVRLRPLTERITVPEFAPEDPTS